MEEKFVMDVRVMQIRWQRKMESFLSASYTFRDWACQMHNGIPSIAVEANDELVVTRFFPILDEIYNTTIIYSDIGECSARYDACLFSIDSNQYRGYGPWKIWDASHTIPHQLIHDWVRSPILIVVNREATFRREDILGIGKRFENVFSTNGASLPCGVPAKIRYRELNPLKTFSMRLREVLDEAPILTLKREPDTSRFHSL